MPDEITYFFAVFPLTWGLPGLIWLGTVYEFKDQLLSLFLEGGGKRMEEDRAAILRCECTDTLPEVPGKNSHPRRVGFWKSWRVAIVSQPPEVTLLPAAC